ncbi:hypothetical protein [Salinibaculum rarum]|uniref:hypothetical protein n=1 Tax=Salinibaculum rarum TaxID=3058903 RepID=UPI00265EA010|nr:hypothetical protein [Salinibaculum sp. KK48]
MTFWLIKSGYPDIWNHWVDELAISVGWDVGPHEDEAWKDLRSRIKDKFGNYSNKKAGDAVSAIKTVAGNHRDESMQMQEGDTVIIIGMQSVYGKSVVRGVVKVGSYSFRETGISPTGDHTYTREIDEWRYGNKEDEGPVPKTWLDDDFQMHADNTLHLPETIQKSSFQDQETLDRLVEQLHVTEAIEEPAYNLRVNSERAVEEYLVGNIDRLIDGAESTDLRQQAYLNDNCRADLYYEPDDNSRPLIVEIKQGEAGTDNPNNEDAYDQLKRYMRIEREKGNDVGGLVVAEAFDPEVNEKVAGDDDVEMRQIEIDLRFEPVT